MTYTNVKCIQNYVCILSILISGLYGWVKIKLNVKM